MFVTDKDNDSKETKRITFDQARLEGGFGRHDLVDRFRNASTSGYLFHKSILTARAAYYCPSVFSLFGYPPLDKMLPDLTISKIIDDREVSGMTVIKAAPSRLVSAVKSLCASFGE